MPYQLFQERHDDNSYNGDLFVTQANGASHEWSSRRSRATIRLSCESNNDGHPRHLQSVNEAGHREQQTKWVSFEPAYTV